MEGSSGAVGTRILEYSILLCAWPREATVAFSAAVPGAAEGRGWLGSPLRSLSALPSVALRAEGFQDLAREEHVSDPDPSVSMAVATGPPTCVGNEAQSFPEPGGRRVCPVD